MFVLANILIIQVFCHWYFSANVLPTSEKYLQNPFAISEYARFCMCLLHAMILL